ncbi:MAG: hypothetical protein Q8Q52_08025 [Acidimicrobiia bacterium]|nr:hypothetical protein [Acidimicrobiia bacterium]
MYDDPPESINLKTLRLQQECPASYGAGTKVPTAAFDRWKAVADACGSWHLGTEVDDIIRDQFSAFDPVQRDLCLDLLSRYTDLMADHRDALVVEEGDPVVTIMHPNGHASTSAWYQFRLNGKNGPELIKIRTGLRGSTPDEVAVLVQGKDPDESATEVMLRHGTVETLEMDAALRATEIRRVFSLWEETRSDAWQGDKRTPGRACYTVCPRPARCGQYPTPDGRRVSADTRTIRLPKTAASWMRQCDRHTAWKQVYQIPKDDGQEFDEARGRGASFHDLLAEALLADDPNGAFQDAVADLPDASRLQWLWEQHLTLEVEHAFPVAYQATEYQIGVTVQTTGLDVFRRSDRPGHGKPVAVVFMARPDATGREGDDTSAIVEVRTGASRREADPLELDVYALGAALLKKVNRVAIHVHLLGLPEGPECHREVYEEDRLRLALQRLEEPALRAAAWDPLDATRPSFNVGQWCGDCEFRLRCENYRAGTEG